MFLNRELALLSFILAGSSFLLDAYYISRSIERRIRECTAIAEIMQTIVNVLTGILATATALADAEDLTALNGLRMNFSLALVIIVSISFVITHGPEKLFLMIFKAQIYRMDA